MKQIKRMLLTAFGALFLVFAAIGAAACGGGKFTVTTNFDASQGSVTVSAPAKGETYQKNEEVTVTVTANSGFEVDTFKVNDAAADLASGKYTFKITQNTTIAVTFKATQTPPATTYTVKTEFDNQKGKVELSGTSPYAANSQVTVTVTANSGFEVDTFKVNGKDETLTSGKYTFTITQDTTIAVTFKATQTPPETTYTVTVTCGTEGSYALSGTSPYAANSDVTITVTPNQGFEIDTFTVNGTATAITGNTYTFKITQNTTINITFKATTPTPGTSYTVTVTCDSAQGSYTLDPQPTDGKYAEGTSVTLTVTPEDGFEVDKVVFGEEELTATDGKYTFTVDADKTLAITFKATTPEHVITFEEEMRGEWTMSGSGPDNYTITIDEHTLTIKDAEGNEVKDYEFFDKVVWGDSYDHYLTWNGTDYLLATLANDTLLTLTDDHDNVIYFVGETTDFTLAEEIYGTYTCEGQPDLVLSASGLQWGIATIVPLCEDEGNADQGDFFYYTYHYLIDGNYYALSASQGVDGHADITLGELYFTFKPEETHEGIPVPNDLFEGVTLWGTTWKTKDEDHTLEIDDAGMMKIDGEDVVYYLNDGSPEVIWNDVSYMFVGYKDDNVGDVEGEFALRLQGNGGLDDQIKFYQEGGTPVEPEYFTVTINKNREDGGTVEIETEPNCENGTFKEGTEVTVKITANEGFRIAEVELNGMPWVLESDSITFSIDENTTISVTFRTFFNSRFEGTWQTPDEGTKLTITASGITVEVDGEEVEDVTFDYVSSTEYSISFNGRSYALKSFNGASGKAFLLYLTDEDGAYTWLVNADAETAAFDATYAGTYGLVEDMFGGTPDETHTIVIGADGSVTIEGEEATILSEEEGGMFLIATNDGIYEIGVFDDGSLGGPVILVLVKGPDFNNNAPETYYQEVEAAE